MKGKNILQKIGGFFLAATLVIAVAIMSSSAVQAQRGFRGGRGFHGGGGFHTRVFIGPRFGFGYPYGYYGYFGYPYSMYSPYVFGDSEAAESQGYHDGLKTGASDAHRGQSDDPERSHHFKDAGFGNFADDYRDGFERGYEAGYGR